MYNPDIQDELKIPNNISMVEEERSTEELEVEAASSAGLRRSSKRKTTSKEKATNNSDGKAKKSKNTLTWG